MWPNRHNYCREYGKLFRGIRKNPGSNFLEIGLCRGWFENWPQDDVPSLKMWLKYFPTAKIFGFDIADFSFFSHNRVKIFRGNQGNREHLDNLVLSCGCRFDIVIDDGSHVSRDQQISLGVLFRQLKSGGLYIIEDLNWQPPEAENPHSEKTRRVLSAFQENGRIESEDMKPEERCHLNKYIDSVTLYGPGGRIDKPQDSKLAVIRKALEA